MPRSRGGARPAPAPRQQTRSSSTYAAPARTAAPPPPPAAAHAPATPQVQSSQPSMFSQMASTAAGVAVGSAVGHTLANGVSSLFGSSSNSVPAEQVQQTTQQPQQAARACDVDARNFTKCLDDNGGNMQICDWYLQQLKACQEAARSY